MKCQKQVRGRRGSLVTIVFGMSAAGLFVRPVFMRPQVNVFKKFAANKSGGILLDLIIKWFKHFVN